MRRSRLCSALLLLALLLPVSPLLADTASSPDDSSEARLLALIEELATLLDSLPPERRDALRRLIDERLAELPSASTPSAEDEAPRVAESPPPPPELPSPAVPPTATTPPPTAATPPPVTTPTATAVIRPPSPTTRRTTTPPPPRPIEPPSQQPAPSETEPDPAEPPAAPADPVSPTPGPRLRCELAVPLDTDQDRRLTAFDRYWRHLYLWTDVDGDGDLDEREAESPYERGIRSVELGLGSFVRGKGKRKRTLDITIEERVIFDVGGDGYGGPVPRRDDGALVIDASAVRDDGGPDLRDANGEPLVGLQAIRPGQRWVLTDGSTLVPRCR